MTIRGVDSNNARLGRRPLQIAKLDAVHGDAAKEFGIEVSGFLRHDFVARGDFHYLFDVDRIEEERDLRAAGVHGSDGCAGFAFVGEIHFFSSGLQGDAQRRFENAIVEKNDIQIALQGRNIVKQLRQIGARTQVEKIKGALSVANGWISTDGALLGGGSKARQEFCAGLRFFRIVRKGKNLRGEPRLQIAADRGPGKIENVGNDAMTGEDDQVLTAGVDESHHGAFVVRVGIECCSTGAAFVAIVERGFVTMVAVGDNQPLIGHSALDALEVIWLRNHPQAMNHAVFVGEFGNRNGGGLRFVENFLHLLLRIGIQHEKLAGVEASLAKQFETVGLGTGKRVFVAENDASGIFLEPACTDKAATRTRFAAARKGEFLRVGVESWRGILQDDAIANPLFHFGFGTGVDIILLRFVRENAALFDGDQIMRVRGVIFGLPFWRNLVVRLREDAVEGSELRIEAVRAKREYLSHEFSGALQHDSGIQYFTRRRARNATRVLK